MNPPNPEIVLIVGDLHIPSRVQDVPEQFKNILLPHKVQHVLSLGNIGSKETYDWLKSLSNNFHGVKGEIDEVTNLPETSVVQIGEFRIGMIHGHQVTPWNDQESLINILNQLGCDILLSGHTHSSNVTLFKGKHFINPGSLTGAYSPLSLECNPSFMILVIQGDAAQLYYYEINSSNLKFEVSKTEFTKIIEDKEEEEK